MGMTNRELYEAAGGGEYRLVPCLNTHPAWIEAMAAIVRRELHGWEPNPDLKTTGLRRRGPLEPGSHARPRREGAPAVGRRRSSPADPTARCTISSASSVAAREWLRVIVVKSS